MVKMARCSAGASRGSCPRDKKTGRFLKVNKGGRVGFSDKYSVTKPGLKSGEGTKAKTGHRGPVHPHGRVVHFSDGRKVTFPA